jgi:hypothetical protein
VLVVGCWLLVVEDWLLVVGCWCWLMTLTTKAGKSVFHKTNWKDTEALEVR